MPQRITRQALRLLETMLIEPAHEWYGFELMERADLRSGTVYPLLHRLQKDGWLTSHREEIDPRAEGRPRRRLYRLTAEGERSARAITAERASPSRIISPVQPVLRPRGAGA